MRKPKQMQLDKLKTKSTWFIGNWKILCAPTKNLGNNDSKINRPNCLLIIGKNQVTIPNGSHIKWVIWSNKLTVVQCENTAVQSNIESGV